MGARPSRLPRSASRRTLLLPRGAHAPNNSWERDRPGRRVRRPAERPSFPRGAHAPYNSWERDRRRSPRPASRRTLLLPLGTYAPYGSWERDRPGCRVRRPAERSSFPRGAHAPRMLWRRPPPAASSQSQKNCITQPGIGPAQGGFAPGFHKQVSPETWRMTKQRGRPRRRVRRASRPVMIGLLGGATPALHFVTAPGPANQIPLV